MENKNKKLIMIIAIIVLVILILGTGLVVFKLINKNSKASNETDIYNKQLHVSALLPNIQGNNNVSKDEFGKKTNISEEIKVSKNWKNLDFTDFSVYSYNSSTSVISFNITNNTNMIVETSDFQLQLKDNDLNIASIIDFDALVLPCGANVAVTVDVTGDITNVKDIVVDEINYTMELQEVK